MRLFVMMGEGLSDEQAMERRRRFLQGLLGESRTGFAGQPLQVSPCSAVDAYHCFVAICGCLGVRIEDAAKKLERVIRRQR